MTTDVLISTNGKAGIITLNRPQALNALTHGMVVAMDEALQKWAKDPAIEAVIVEGAGGRAFCAGGDVKGITIEMKAAKDKGEDCPAARDFFRAEYTLNHRIHTFPKPYISLIDGVVMGGGMGISAHGSHRVATENVLFAMPEANIGFFPDVGGGYFLSRRPGQTGLYLALTCQRAKAFDARYIGFSTHTVPAESLALVRDEIIASPSHLEDILSLYDRAPDAAASELAPHRAQIDACFAHNRVEDIVAALEADGSDWAQETLHALAIMSPSSLKIALRQIRLSAKMSFAEIMVMEYRLAQACLARPDFYEGVRAALIDKDRRPRWSPARVTDVTEAEIEQCFQKVETPDIVF